jgi:putative phage-type endonuclease
MKYRIKMRNMPPIIYNTASNAFNTFIDQEYWYAMKRGIPLTLRQIPIERVHERINQVDTYREQLNTLKTVPFVAQRTSEWYDMRKTVLTASSLAQALGKDKYSSRKKLVKAKAFPELVNPLYMTIPPIHWGVMFEPMALRCYQQLHDDIPVHEFGLLRHKELECFAASPDGINEMGILVEFKCPWKRPVDGNVPLRYHYQMQGQMAVCNLEECDFVDCEFKKYYTKKDYIKAVMESYYPYTLHGIVIESGSKQDPSFLYSPPHLSVYEAIDWLKTNHQKHMKYHMWRLNKVHTERQHFNQQEWKQITPHIKHFWADVMELRQDVYYT